MADKIAIHFDFDDMDGPTISDLIGKECKITYRNGELRYGRITRVDMFGVFTSVNQYEIYYRTNDLRKIEEI